MDYKFHSHWRVNAAPEEVTEILSDGTDLPRWWPDVYLKVDEVEPGTYKLLTKGWLPYKLRWSFRVTERRTPNGFSLEAWGDLEGNGVWKFTRDVDFTDVDYDWTVYARKPLLRILSPFLKPLFEWNHRWAMARGEESLKREIERRRARAA